MKEQLNSLSQGTTETDNFFQRIARKTRGVATPANLVSVLGLALTADGLRRAAKGDMAVGLTEAAVGMAADAVDGAVARKTGTSEIPEAAKLGEMVDVVADFGKAGVSAWFLHKTGLVPAGYSAAIFGPKVVNAATSITSKLRGNEPHKVEFDRRVEVARYVGTGAIAANNLLEKSGHGLGKFGKGLNIAIAGGILAAGLYGSAKQAKRYQTPGESPANPEESAATE
jgi:phosphatidylglycerophosphate synthase